MEHMSSLANLGHTVIASIHQPRSAIWDMFDKVCAYNTPDDSFRAIGYKCNDGGGSLQGLGSNGSWYANTLTCRLRLLQICHLLQMLQA